MEELKVSWRFMDHESSRKKEVSVIFSRSRGPEDVRKTSCYGRVWECGAEEEGLSTPRSRLVGPILWPGLEDTGRMRTESYGAVTETGIVAA